MLLIDIARVPVFVSVIVLGGLVVPTCWSPKSTDAGESVATAAGGCVPVPESAAVCGPPGAVSSNLSAAVRAFVWVGVNVTQAVQLSPGDRIEKQLQDCAKSPAFAPVIETPFSKNDEPPVFVIVTPCRALVDPTLWEPKSSAAGVAVASAAAAPPPPLRATVCGLVGSASPITRVALWGPALAGPKATGLGQEPPGARESGFIGQS